MTRLHVFLPYGPSAASARVRVYDWLERTDVEAVVRSYVGQRDARPATLLSHPMATWAAERRLRAEVHGADGVVLLHVEASPLSSGRIERQLLSGAAFSTFDMDDGYPWDWGDESVHRRLRPKARKAVVGAQHADRVIAGNDLLADWASAWAREVVVIPSCVDPAAYPVKSRYEPSDPPRIGWIGSPATEGFLEPVERALLDVHRRTGARLTVVSRGQRTLGPLDAIVDRVEWTPQATSLLATWDVGIMPLPGGLYDRAKCGYKLLQYAAAGLPVVASPVGVNADLLRDIGGSGPMTDNDWADALSTLLLASAADRASAGQRARGVAEERYSYDAWRDRWVAAVSPT